MAFKFIATFCAILAVANAGAISYGAAPAVVTKIVNPSVDAVASTQQNVVRSFGGTVSTYSKAVDTPYSSVRKSDSRITNNVYTPTVAKTLTYAAPAYTKTVAYAAPAPVVAKAISYAPAPTAAVYSHASPVLTKTYAAPAVHYAAPTVVNSYGAPVPTVAAYTASASPVQYYSHAAPVAAASVVKHAITYSPAAAVAHVSFDGFGAHWGY